MACRRSNFSKLESASILSLCCGSRGATGVHSVTCAILTGYGPLLIKSAVTLPWCISKQHVCGCLSAPRWHSHVSFFYKTLEAQISAITKLLNTLEWKERSKNSETAKVVLQHSGDRSTWVQFTPPCLYHQKTKVPAKLYRIWQAILHEARFQSIEDHSFYFRHGWIEGDIVCIEGGLGSTLVNRDSNSES